VEPFRYTIRTLLLLASIGSAFLGCVKIILAHYGFYSFFGLPNLPPLFYQVAPWLLILTSYIAWNKFRQWRRMQALQIVTTNLSRGDHSISRKNYRPSSFERFFRLLILIGIVTLPYWFGVSNPEWLLALSVPVWIFFKIAARAFKPQQ
jgi:hypothetical protein